MQGQIEEMEMQIGKIDPVKPLRVKTKIDIALLRMRVEYLEDVVLKLERRVFGLEVKNG